VEQLTAMVKHFLLAEDCKIKQAGKFTGSLKNLIIAI
jgi:hypothetical protein